MEPLGVQPESFAPILIPLMMRKMPKKLVQKFKLKIKDDDNFSLDKYFEFLEEWATVKDVESSAEVKRANTESSFSGKFPWKRERRYPPAQRYSTSALRASVDTQSRQERSENKKFGCIFCKMNNHLTIHCGKAKQLTLRESKSVPGM